MVLFPHFNTACNWNLKTLLLLLEIIDGCANRWGMVLFPHESESCSWEAQSSNSSATSQVVDSIGAKHCGRSWEKNSCSFLTKTGKETIGFWDLDLDCLSIYLFSSNVGFYKRQKNKREEHQREREKRRGQGRTAQKQRGERAVTKRQDTWRFQNCGMLT
jgi:hypothetical protein